MVKKKQTKRIERIAYHEAGHAVMCYILRQRFSYVTIVPGEDYFGKVVTKYRKSYWKDVEWMPDPQKVEKVIKISLAGLVGESIITGQNRWKAAAEDMHNAVDIASYLYGNPVTVGKYIDFLLSWLRDYLKDQRYKVMISSLAATLLEHKKIGYQKTRSIIKEAQRQFLKDELDKVRKKGIGKISDAKQTTDNQSILQAR